MKLKTFAQQVREEFMESSQQYCLYCLTPKDDKFHCCKENHFGEFKYMSDEDQKFLIQEAIDGYETWSKQ